MVQTRHCSALRREGENSKKGALAGEAGSRKSLRRQQRHDAAEKWWLALIWPQLTSLTWNSPTA